MDAGATYNAALKEGRGAIPRAKNLRVIARTDASSRRLRGPSGFPTKAILTQKAISVSTRDAAGRSALEPLGDINGFVRVSDVTTVASETPRIGSVRSSTSRVVSCPTPCRTERHRTMTIPSPIDVVALAALAAPSTRRPTSSNCADSRPQPKGTERALRPRGRRTGLDLAHFHAEPDEIVIHHGQNSLPAFNQFQKRAVSNDGTLRATITRPWVG